MTITLKTLGSAPLQEVFNQAAEHLLHQRKKSQVYSSESQASVCCYRSDTGLRCAVGCFIADDEYIPEIEGFTWHYSMFPNLMAATNEQKEFMARYDVTNWPKQTNVLLVKLQVIHDSSPVGSWGFDLAKLANEWGLSVPERVQEELNARQEKPTW